MKSQESETLDSFDKESFTAEFEKAVPQIIVEMCDLFEVRPPRVTRKVRREMAEQMASGFEVSVPHLKALEETGEDIEQIDKRYRIMEGLFRRLLRQSKVRLKPGEDAFDYLLRKSTAVLRARYSIRRLKQYRLVREGIERLIASVLNCPEGEAAAGQLIEEFIQKHLKEDMRYANALEARLKRHRNRNLMRMSKNNITWLAEEYRDAAATFERRLRLLVGLSYIARGEAKTYAELRGRDYNSLLQVVNSPNHPLLHFLQGVVDRHVRNALMHGGMSSSPAKGVVRFVDYSARTREEHEVVWTMSKFYRQTWKLVLTISTVAYLELLFKHVCLYRKIAVVRYLSTNPPSDSSAGGGTEPSIKKAARATPRRRKPHQTL